MNLFLHSICMWRCLASFNRLFFPCLIPLCSSSLQPFMRKSSFRHDVRADTSKGTDRLQLSRLNLQDDALHEPVSPLGIIPFLQTAAESPRKSLIETGTHRTEESLYKFVGG